MVGDWVVEKVVNFRRGHDGCIRQEYSSLLSLACENGCEGSERVMGVVSKSILGTTVAL